MAAVGTALWVASGICAALLARIVPIRRGRFVAEFLVSILTACVAGLIATALDFGGWREPDWRAGLFALLVACAATAVLRMSRLRWA